MGLFFPHLLHNIEIPPNGLIIYIFDKISAAISTIARMITIVHTITTPALDSDEPEYGGGTGLGGVGYGLGLGGGAIGASSDGDHALTSAGVPILAHPHTEQLVYARVFSASHSGHSQLS
jgi:hypothetical protein